MALLRYHFVSLTNRSNTTKTNPNTGKRSPSEGASQKKSKKGSKNKDEEALCKQTLTNPNTRCFFIINKFCEDLQTPKPVSVRTLALISLSRLLFAV